MAHKEIELILMRQLAGYLATAVFIVDAAGTLVFYNEPAEIMLGRRFEETGEMPAAEWSTIFKPTDERGAAIAPQALPLSVALTERRMAQGDVWIRGFDDVLRHTEAVAFPIIGHGGRFLGAAAISREVREK